MRPGHRELVPRSRRARARCRAGVPRPPDAAVALRAAAVRAASAPRPPAARASGDRARQHRRCTPSSRSSSRRAALGLPVVGNIASWDHTVGKGIVRPGPAAVPRPERRHARRPRPLPRHRADRVVVTGWPQTDVFHRRRPRADYEAVATRARPRSEAPGRARDGQHAHERTLREAFVERLVSWWEESGARERFSLLFRPHPRDREWRERFAAALRREGAAVQEPSFTDLETLAVLLQHGDVVVSNAGTILLDALVNDSPAVCVLYDEGAPPGRELGAEERERRALQAADRVGGVLPRDALRGGHRRHRARACATGRARGRASARRAREVVGEIDGRAAERVADADRRRPIAWALLAPACSLVAVAASFGFLVAVWIALPWVVGDTPFVLDGSNAFLDCLSQHDYSACGYTGKLNYWGLMTPVGDWPLLQHVPDLIAIGLGGDGHAARTRVLAVLSVVGVVGTIGLAWIVLRRVGQRAWFWGFLLVVLSSPLLWYARTTSGEALATGLLVASRRRDRSPGAPACRRARGDRRVLDEGDLVSVRRRSRRARARARETPDRAVDPGAPRSWGPPAWRSRSPPRRSSTSSATGR